MTLPMILAPLFVLVLMTFVIGFLLAGVRTPLLTSGGFIKRPPCVASPWMNRRLHAAASKQALGKSRP